LHGSSPYFEKDDDTEEAGECIGDRELYQSAESVAEENDDLQLPDDEVEDEDGDR
jgi:hypothetical protein